MKCGDLIQRRSYMEGLTKKEQKAIATIIAKEVVRQMKSDNNELSDSKTPNGGFCTDKDIKNAFHGVELNPKAIELLKSLDYQSLIGAVYAYIKLKKALSGIMNKHTVLDATTVRRVLLASDTQFNKIINRTEKIKSIGEFIFDEWKLIVLSSKFDDIYNRLLQIANVFNCTTLPRLSRSFVLEEIVIKSSDTFFSEYLSRLSYVYQKYGDQWRVFEYEITRESFRTLEKRVSYFYENKFAIFSQLSLHELVNLCSSYSDDECIKRSRKVLIIIQKNAFTIDWLKNHLGKEINSSIYYALLTSLYDKLDFLHIEYKRYLEQVEYKKFPNAKEYSRVERENTIKHWTIQPLEIGRKCTGNCSTCNRSECIEDKSPK